MRTPKCDSCGKSYIIPPWQTEVPTMLGFVEDGKTINVCSRCLCKLGRMDDAGQKKFFADLGIEMHGKY